MRWLKVELVEKLHNAARRAIAQYVLTEDQERPMKYLSMYLDELSDVLAEIQLDPGHEYEIGKKEDTNA